jgi:hypothetical protein
MSLFRITEFDKTGVNDIPKSLPIVQYPCVTVQAALTLSESSQQSAAFDAFTTFICVSTEAACTFAVGADPTASADSELLSAGESRYLGVRPGDKIAVKAA